MAAVFHVGVYYIHQGNDMPKFTDTPDNFVTVAAASVEEAIKRVRDEAFESDETDPDDPEDSRLSAVVIHSVKFERALDVL